MSKNQGISRRTFLNASLGGLAAAGLGPFSGFAGFSNTADLVITGSPVLTVDYLDSVQGAVAVKGNRILATAKDMEGIRDFIGGNTRIVNYSRGCVTPGMIDVHNHIVAQATTTINWVDLIRCLSTQQVQETLAKWIVEHDWKPGKWVRGVGYMWIMDKMVSKKKEEFRGPPLFTRWDIDEIVEVNGKKVDLSRYPIFLVQISGHYASVNSLGLIKSKIMDKSGRFYSGRDKKCLTVSGRSVESAFNPKSSAFGSFFNISTHKGTKQIDGMIFHHYAMEEFYARGMIYGGYPKLDDREITAALKQRSNEFIRKGVTSIYDNNFRIPGLLSHVKSFPRVAAVHEKLRITLYPYIGHLNKGAFPAFDSSRIKGVTSRAPLFNDDWMRLIGYKLQIDAATMTGLTWKPNNSLGDPTKGKLNLWKYDEYLEIVRLLDRMGAQISIHVVGDKALDWTIDAYEEAGVGGGSRRHRIEHVVCVPQISVNTPQNRTEPLYPRVRDQNLIFCPQPGFILLSALFFEQAFGSGVGQFKQDKIFPRFTHSIPYRSAVEAGVRVALSSDNPCVIETSPLLALWESVHRRTCPVGKGSPNAIPSYVYNHRDEKGDVYDERVDINQAIRGHTIDAAYSGFEDKVKGSIEDGKLADLVIWDKDIRLLGERTPLKKALEIKPVMTIIDGKIAYQDKTSVKIEKA